MTALNGWPAVSGAATFQDIRRSLAGMVVKSAAGVLRKGILPINTTPLLSGTASMVINVATHVAVLDRNGAVFMPNEGVTPVTLSSAPVSGSRWSVIFDKQRETEPPFADAVNGPQIDKVESTTSLALARESLPAGALELGYVQVNAGSANTLDTGVTITETVPYTAMEGGTVLVRNDTELQAWQPHDGSFAYQLDNKLESHRIGGAWVPWNSDWRTGTGGLVAGTGVINAGSSDHVYKYMAGVIIDTVTVTITNAGNGGGGLDVALPFSFTGTWMGSGRSEIDGAALIVRVQGGVARVFKYNNTTPIAVGTLLFTFQCRPA